MKRRVHWFLAAVVILCSAMITIDYALTPRPDDTLLEAKNQRVTAARQAFKRRKDVLSYALIAAVAGFLIAVPKREPRPVLPPLRPRPVRLNGRRRPLPPTLQHIKQRALEYSINSKCTGCTLCAQVCPPRAIPFEPYKIHSIDALLCTHCDLCRQVCEDGAVDVTPFAEPQP